uniref:Uncharacterized protein n=1 Tax=Triticum urartu TaxID=4572 RepID=A0A8R7QSY4_TRIUA
MRSIISVQKYDSNKHSGRHRYRAGSLVLGTRVEILQQPLAPSVCCSRPRPSPASREKRGIRTHLDQGFFVSL